MKPNEGVLDRTIRVLLGLWLLSLALIDPKTYWAYLGVIPLVTGIVGVCPLYSLFRINTCGAKKTG